MNIRTLLEQQGVYSPALEKELIEAINHDCLDIPLHSIPADPDLLDELEWLVPLNLGPCPMRMVA